MHAPGAAVLACFYRPGGGGFELFCCPGMENSPIKKVPGGFAQGGWSGLELTDTLGLVVQVMVLISWPSRKFQAVVNTNLAGLIM